MLVLMCISFPGLNISQNVIVVSTKCPVPKREPVNLSFSIKDTGKKVTACRVFMT